MLNGKLTTKNMARSGIIGAIYAAVTLLLYPISYGGVQVRISEALTLLPLIFPEAIIGLTIGCLIANFFGNGVIDIIFGTLATLVAAVCTYFAGKKLKSKKSKIIVGGFFPVVLNAIVVPFTIAVASGSWEAYFIIALQVLLGQTIAVYVFGTFFYLGVEKLHKKKVL